MVWEGVENTGTSVKKDLVLVVDKDKDGELSVGDYYCEFIIRSDQDSLNLGKLRLYDTYDELKVVAAGDVP